MGENYRYRVREERAVISGEPSILLRSLSGEERMQRQKMTMEVMDDYYTQYDKLDPFEDNFDQEVKRLQDWKEARLATINGGDHSGPASLNNGAMPPPHGGLHE